MATHKCVVVTLIPEGEERPGFYLIMHHECRKTGYRPYMLGTTNHYLAAVAWAKQQEKILNDKEQEKPWPSLKNFFQSIIKRISISS